MPLVRHHDAKAYKMTRSLDISVNECITDITKKYRAEVLASRWSIKHQGPAAEAALQQDPGVAGQYPCVLSDPQGRSVISLLHGFSCDSYDPDHKTLDVPSQSELMALSLQGDRQIFDFDRVFGMNCTQEEIFEDTRPIIMSCVDGASLCARRNDL